jgi:hypothetical protein
VYGYQYSASGAVGTITPASFIILVPSVTDEIVNISLLPGTTEDKPKPENVVVVTETPANGAVHTQSLPMCRP